MRKSKTDGSIGRTTYTNGKEKELKFYIYIYIYTTIGTTIYYDQRCFLPCADRISQHDTTLFFQRVVR